MKSQARRIEALERRLAWLEKRVAASRAAEKPLSYDAEEAGALRWALPILREHVVTELAPRRIGVGKRIGEP